MNNGSIINDEYDDESEFDNHVQKRPCAVWVIRVLNVLIMILGAVLLGVSAWFVHEDLPLGNWPVALVVQGCILIFVGLFGICSTKSEGFATMYFLFMLLMSVFIGWASIYLWFNRTAINGTIRASVENKWTVFYPKLPTEVKTAFSKVNGNCATLNSTKCWEALEDKYYKPKRTEMLVLVLMQLMLVPTVFVCVGRLLGAKKAVNSVTFMMDTIMLITGLVIVVVGYRTYALHVESTQGVAVLAIIVGCTLIVLATVFGAYCDRCYNACCNSCNLQWAIVAFVYFIMAVILLALGIAALNTSGGASQKIRTAVTKNMDKICPHTCQEKLISGFHQATEKQNCTQAVADQSWTGAIKHTPCTKDPTYCYQKAIELCDKTEALNAKVAMLVQDGMNNAAWSFFLGVGYLFVQIVCKTYKWKFEDEHDDHDGGLYSSPGSYGGGSYGGNA